MKAVVLTVAVCGLLVADQAFALYARPQLENTPIDRLVENISAHIRANPKDVDARFNLARLHAMAYATKSDTAQVAGRQPNQAWLGYEPKHVPFKLAKTDDPAKQKAANAQLEMAIKQYKKVIEMKPDNLSAQLGYGWCLEQAGKKKEAIAQYRKTIDLAWAKEKDMQFGNLGWHSVVKEAAGYLMPHLDAETDEKELTKLRVQVKKVSSIPRPVTPIAIPLRDGLSLEQVHDRDARVTFDIDGSGQAKAWSWISQDAGWLVYDADGSGKVTSALQMFGNVTFWLFWDNGYQAMQSLDNDHDGMLTGDELDRLAIWHDKNSNGISDVGEVQPLVNWNITKLSCQHLHMMDQDQTPYSPYGVYFQDGSYRATYDVVLQSKSGTQVFIPAVGNRERLGRNDSAGDVEK